MHLCLFEARAGWKDWLMIRDYKRRIICKHFQPLRARLNAMRKNTILPKEVQVIFNFCLMILAKSLWVSVSLYIQGVPKQQSNFDFICSTKDTNDHMHHRVNNLNLYSMICTFEGELLRSYSIVFN